MAQDTRTYAHRQWDALVGVSDGFPATDATYLAATKVPGTVTLGTVGANIANAITRVNVSFFGTPSGTSLLYIQNGGTTVFGAYLFAGQNQFTFTPPLLGSLGNQMDVIVQPGGGTTIMTVHGGTVVPFPYVPVNNQ